MAFTAAQKAQIKQRAEALVASGVPTGEAAQQAIRELFSTEQIQTAFGTSPQVIQQAIGTAPPTETRTPQVQDVDVKLRQEEATYVRERTRQLVREGLKEQEAETRARQELEQNIRQPAPLGYGTVDERQEPSFPGVRVTEIEGQAGIPASGIQFDKLQTLFQEQLGMDEQEAGDQVQTFRTLVLEPRLEKLNAEGVVGEEADRQALEQSFDFLQQLNTRLTDKDTYLQPDTEGSRDPWIRAFSRQVEIGEGVPDITPEMRTYLNATIEDRTRREVKRRLDAGETKQVIRLANGSEVPYDAEAMRGQRAPLPQGSQIVSVPKTEEDIRAEVEAQTEQPWWLSDQADAIRANPEAFEETGFFETTTPYGTKKEALGGYLLRSALTIPNAFAGLMTDIAYSSEDLAAGRQRIREEKGYGDDLLSPALQNIAENRGFYGEAVEAADLAKVRQVGGEDSILPEGTGDFLYGVTQAGGFAADLLDPSLDIAKGITTGFRAAGQNLAATRAVYGRFEGRPTSRALADALGQGANDILDSNVVTALVNLRVPVGDFRNLMTRQVTRDLTAQSDLLLRQADDAATAYASLSPELQNSVFGRRFKDAIQSGDDVATTLGRMPADTLATAGREVIDDISRIVNDPNATLATARRRDVARALGAAAKADESVARVIEPAMTTGAGVSGTKLTNAIRDLANSPQQFKVFTTALLSDLAAREVVKATKGISGAGFENVVAVTKNTFLDRATAKKVLDEVKGSPIGKLGAKLADPEKVKIEPIVAQRGSIPFGGEMLDPITGADIGATANRVLPAYKLDAALKQEVAAAIDELQTFGKLDAVTARQMRKRARGGHILLEDYRKLLDANIDLVAEGRMAAGTRGTTIRARDVARLPVGEQVELLMPMEQRSFSRTVARKLYEKLTGRTPKLGNLSVGQRQLLQQARTKMSSLDTELRRGISQLGKDPELKRLYGLDPDTDYSVPELVAALIVGAKGGDRLITTGRDVRIALEGIIDDLFYTKSTTENVFDLFTGSSVSKKGGVFTADGQAQLQPLLDTAVNNIMARPETLWTELAPVIAEAQRIVASGDPKLLRRPDDIVDVFAKNKNKIPPEVQVGGFYRAEARRIADELVSDLINTEVGKGRISIFDELTPDLQDRVGRTMNRAGARASAGGIPLPGRLPNFVQTNFIKNRAKRLLNGQKGIMDATDIQEVLRVDATTAARLAADPAFMRDFGLMSELGEDVANAIIRRNELRGAADPIGETERLIADLNKPDTDGYKRLNLLFGENVANQLRDELTSGFDKLRDEILDLLDKGAVERAEGIWNTIQNIRYFLLLNVRPRFHGANLLTGADIFYSTTGKVPNLEDIWEGVKVLENTSPNKVIFTDRAGRPYTSGELNQLLTQGAGQTAYRAALPSADQERLIALLNKGEGWYGNAVENFKALPQAEDSLFRYAAMKAALREGRTLEEAVALARRSMFDVSDISNFEKGFKRLALFYGFQRNNIANAIRNLASPTKGWQRIGKAERFRKDLTDIMLGDNEGETRAYSPSYSQTRIILDKIGFDPSKGKELILTSPPLASLDAIYSLADVLKGQTSGLFGGALRSEYKALLGVEDKFAIDPDHIPAEHMAILGLTGADPLDAVNLLLTGLGAEPTSYVPTTEIGKGMTIEGREGRYVIPLVTPKQKRAYTMFMTTLAYTGMASPVSDYARSISAIVGDAEGTKLETLPMADRLAYIGAGKTPITYQTPEQQAYYDRVSRLRQLQALNRVLEEDETARMALETTPEERERGAQIEARREQRQEQRAAVRRQQRTVREIGEEMRSVAGRMRSDPRNYAVYRQRILELREELAEAKAREAAGQNLQ